MDKLKILVACHKPYDKVYRDNVYIPIQVGKAIRPNLNLGYITDATGDNISEQNSYYCELTAAYWGWKNLDCEYIGLNHYRRYFDFIFTDANIDKILCHHDVIMSTPVYLSQNVVEFLMSNLIPEDVYVALKLLETMYPEDYSKAESFFTNKIYYPCNMFVCKKYIFDEFAQWEFAYLNKLKNLLHLSGYTREKRILGFIAEALLPIYFFNRKFRVKGLNIVSYPGSNKALFHVSAIQKLSALLYERHRGRKIFYNENILEGLRLDGILDSNNKIIL